METIVANLQAASTDIASMKTAVAAILGGLVAIAILMLIFSRFGK